ncbi:pentapeptide repeat-containing protein [Archangium gephyra]|uniref:pentapeptide repeat-containing protein n=1 Tax=Archangium gephyra TaxID=48 RepID=UPI003B7B298F
MVIEILGGIQVVSSLLQAGMAARDAWKEAGFGKDEVSALSALHKAAEGLWKLKPKQEEELGALHLATVARCFGHAIRRHQEYSKALSTQPPALFQNVAEEERPPQPSAKQIERVLRGAAQGHIAPGALPVGKLEIDLVESLTGSPLNTPYHRFLWAAFFEPVEGEPPLLKLEPGGVREFERSFVLAWGEAMASTTGERLRLYLEDLNQDYKPRLVQEVLISDMAAWGSRHTFGNLARGDSRDGDPLPFMPLEEMYVQPLARDARDRRGAEEGPVLERLERVLQKQRIVILQADFGMGKSLTSRMLACQRARKFRDASVPTAELELPIHVRCADDLRSNDLSISGAVQRARQRQAETLGYSLPIEDKALAFPSSQQKALFLLDGLDEVHLGETGLKTFFDNIKDKARGSPRHRFVIFSRPGAIPSSKDMRALEDIPILELLPWNKEQVDEWLARWRQVNEGRGPTQEEIEKQGLSSLAPTPILLLMMAHTWDPTMTGKAISRSELYERFFQSIARGKHEQDKDTHPAISEASTKLRGHLIDKRLLDRRARETDAMLWLMSRVAWESVRLEQRGMFPDSEPVALERRHIENLLFDELNFRTGDDAAVDSVRVGLLLTLQANLHSHNASQILFGHKSFREFLVARYWADRLKTLAGDPSRRDTIEKSLLGASLLSSPEDESFHFLVDMLNADPKHGWLPGQPFGLSTQERERLFQWAEERYQDERLMGVESPPKLRDDLSSFLRQAALAIGSCLYPDKGLTTRDAYTLRSLFAWSSLLGNQLLLRAPRVKLNGAFLSRMTLRQADLSGADLSDADLSDADLIRADLSGANLSGAQINYTYLIHADLSGATLSDADLSGATLSDADLSGADLSGADLSGATLILANLSGANLSGANLSGANLNGTRYSNGTRWGNFNPAAVGAILIENPELDN